MKYSEFLKLAGNRIELIRHGSRHDVYRVIATGERIEVPRHRAAEMKPGLQQKLLRQTGIIDN